MGDMHKINPNKKDAKKKQIKFTAYTLFGSHERLNKESFPIVSEGPIDENQDIYSIIDSLSANVYAIKYGNTHMIKTGRYGNLFNPLSIVSEPRDRGKPSYVFKEFSKEVFDYYVMFLKTKNSAWLLNAERKVF
jgi:hypothetical protein